MRTPGDGSEFTRDVIEFVEGFLDRKLTPEELERLKRELSHEFVLDALVYSGRPYLVLGSYGTEERNNEEKTRLTMVCEVLNDRHPDHHAFLLADVPDFHENSVLQFLVAAQRVDHVVGVFEHSFGGHEFESGALVTLRSIDLWVLKREYETEAGEREHFDGMMADFFELVDERDALLTWTDETELETIAAEALPGDDG